MKLLRASLLVLLFATGRGPAQEDAAPRSFIAECRMIVLEGKALPALAADLSDAAKASAALARLEQMIARSDAIVAVNLAGPGVEDEKVAVESRYEVRYATEYE